MSPIISLEEHYISSALGASPALAASLSHMPSLESNLRDVGAGRIQAMDAGKLSLQVISHGPTEGNPSQFRAANDELAEAIKLHPSRFAGFAALPMETPAEAAAELRRCVQELGFVGALIDNHANGEFYDDERFWPVFEAAQELDCVIYIHPAWPSDSRQSFFTGNYAASTADALGAFGWGWHVETGLHILRLFAAGLFDRLPKLKVVIGHMGELLPFQLERVIPIANRNGFGKHQRGLKEVWDSNIWLTTSGMFSLNPLSCLLRNTKIDRILYSVDYPFSSNEQGYQFLEDIRKSGLVSEEELQCIAYKNAERLLKVRVTTQS